MNDINKDAVLLKLNKEAQVQALNELGFDNVTMDTPLSEIAECMKWTGGLRDIRLAAYHKELRETHGLTKADWAKMSENARVKYVKIGLWIRCDRTEFIIAAEDVKNESGTYTHKWGGYGVDLKGVQNYAENSVGLFDVRTGKEDTNAAVTQLRGYKDSQNTIGAPASEAAWNYAVSGDVNENGTSNRQWYLPSITQLWLISKYFTQINEAFDVFFSNNSRITTDWYWSSTEYSSSYSWSLHMYGGDVTNYYRNGTTRVRPVASLS